MKKFTPLIVLFIASTAFLTGCDNAEHARKERCTELKNEATDAGFGKAERNYTEIKKDWDKLKCHQSDIIQG